MINQSQWPSPEECDVINFDRLRKFQKNLIRWKAMLAGNDPHSIQQQIINISWDDAIYWSFNEGLALNQNRKKPMKLPASLIELIHDRYFQSQVLLFRRLYEEKAKNHKREVYSIRTVLNEMKIASNLIVREAYVCYDGILYEIEDTRHDWRTKAECVNRHKVFDTFCLFCDKSRNREDKIDINIIESFGQKINDDLEKLNYYSNKYIAHASAIANRKTADKEPPLLSLGYLQELHQSAIWLAQTMGKFADQLVLTSVPTPQFDQLEGWEHLFDRTIKEELYNIWRERVALIKKWARMYWVTDSLYITVTETRNIK